MLVEGGADILFTFVGTFILIGLLHVCVCKV